MATNVFIGVNNTQGVVDQPATIASTTQSKDVELNVLSANVPDKVTLLLAIEKIYDAVLNGVGPSNISSWPLI